MNAFTISALFATVLASGPLFAQERPRVTGVAPERVAFESPARPGVVTLTRTGSTAAALRVGFVLAGIARLGEDYGLECTNQAFTFTPELDRFWSSVEIPAGSAGVTIRIVTTDDAVEEGLETVTLSLEASPSYDLIPGGGPEGLVIIDEDGAPSMGILAIQGQASESGTTALFRLLRSGSSADALSVSFVSKGTAQLGRDFTLSRPSPVTIPSGIVSVDITLTPTPDLDGEGPEMALFELEDGPGYRVRRVAGELGWYAYASIEDAAPVVTVTAIDADASEAGSNPAVFRVDRTGPTTAPMNVWYGLGGQARHNVDYTTDPPPPPFGVPTLTIPAGSSFTFFTITPVDDGLGEGPETVEFLLHLYTEGYQVGNPSFATAIIADNDELPTVSVAVVDEVAQELPADPAVIRISRTGTTAFPLSVTYDLSGTAAKNADYVEPNVWTIPAGASSVDIVFNPIDDTFIESRESAILRMRASAAYVLAAGEATVYIDSDDIIPTVSVAITDATLSEPADSATLTFSRTGPTTARLTLNVSTTGPATRDVDYRIAGYPSVTIPSGASSVTVAVTPIDDTLSEGFEEINLYINPDSAYTIVPYNYASLKLVDDDPLPVVTATAADGSASENGDPGVIRISRTGPTTLPLTVLFTVQGTATLAWDYWPRLADGSFWFAPLTIAAGASSVDLPVIPKEDLEEEGPETILLTLTPSNPFNPRYVIGGGPATVTLEDVPPPPPLVQVTAPDPAASEGGDRGLFTVRRIGSAAARLDLAVEVSGTARMYEDFIITRLVWNRTDPFYSIPAGATAMTFAVMPYDDSGAEGPETVVLRVQPSSTYVLGTDRATVTIADDPAILTIATLDGLSQEGNANDPCVFQVSKSGGNQAGVVVELEVTGTATAGVDFTMPARVTIPGGESKAQIVLPSLADAVAEGVEKIGLKLKPTANYIVGAASEATAVIDDRPILFIDGVLNGMVSVATAEGVPATRTLTLRNSGSTPVTWQADPRTIARYDTAGQAIRSIALRRDAGPAFDIASNGTSLWVTHSYTTGVLDRYDAISGEWTGTLDLHAVVTTPCGISHDNGTLWVSDSTNRRVIQFNLSTAVVEKTFTFPFVVDGIEAAKGRLYAVSALTRKYYAIAKADGTIEEEHDLPAALGAWPLAFGLTYFDGYLWIANYWDGSLVRLFPGLPGAQKVAAPAPYVSGLESDGSKGIWLVNFPAYRIDLVDSGFRQWMSVRPSSGTVAGGATTQVTVTFDPAGLATGYHSGFLSFPGTSFNGGSHGIIVSLRVDPATAPEPAPAPAPAPAPDPTPQPEPSATPAPSPEATPEATPEASPEGQWAAAGEILPNGVANPRPHASANNCAATGAGSAFVLIAAWVALATRAISGPRRKAA